MISRSIKLPVRKRAELTVFRHACATLERHRLHMTAEQLEQEERRLPSGAVVPT